MTANGAAIDNASTSATPHVAGSDWQLTRSQLHGLVQSYVAYARVTKGSYSDLACLKPVAPGAYRVAIGLNSERCWVEPITPLPRELTGLVRVGLVEGWLSLVVACFVAEWSIWLTLWSVIVTFTFASIVIQLTIVDRRRVRARGRCEIPAVVREFLLSVGLWTIAQTEKHMRRYKAGSGLIFDLIGPGLAKGIGVTDQAAEFAAKLAEAATEYVVEKAFDPELGRMSTALLAKTDDWLACNYAVPMPSHLFPFALHNTLGFIG